MRIATVVSSNSHVEYLARVVDSLDTSDPPRPGDYGFGTFVKLDAGNDGEEVAGAVFNSLLMNPDYANYGPRLSSTPDLASFSPDFLDERGSLLAIVLLGDAGADKGHPIPFPVVPAGANVVKMSDAEFEQFHTAPDGSIALGYYGNVIEHTGRFAIPLLESVIDRLQLLDACREEDRSRLKVLRRTLAWQRTVGQMRLS